MATTTTAPTRTHTALTSLRRVIAKLENVLHGANFRATSVETVIQSLLTEVASLGTECDLVHVELRKLVAISDASPSATVLDNKIWNILDSQVGETNDTLYDLEKFVQGARSACYTEADQIAGIRARISRHTDNLRTTQLLMNIVLAQVTPHRAKHQLSVELEKLQNTVETLTRTSETYPSLRSSSTEVALMQHAQETLSRTTSMQECLMPVNEAQAGKDLDKSTGRAISWMNILEQLEADHIRNVTVSKLPHRTSLQNKAGKDVGSVSPRKHQGHHEESSTTPIDQSDDDFEVDMAKAALETGFEAFEDKRWEEAESLLQEALRVMQQHKPGQKPFYDVFDVHFKLAICAFHVHTHEQAEKALSSLIDRGADSEDLQIQVMEAMHMLAQLHVLMRKIDCAKIECERALGARRRILGKRSIAAFQSTALMAHIYVRLNNKARAKSCLAMIPEDQRGMILRDLETTLGAAVVPLEFYSLMARAAISDKGMPPERRDSQISESMSERTAESPVPSQNQQTLVNYTHGVRQPTGETTAPFHDAFVASYNATPDVQAHGVHNVGSIMTKSFSPVESVSGDFPPSNKVATSHPIVAPQQDLHGDAQHSTQNQTLSREDMLARIGCRPRDALEEAVCNGDVTAVAALTKKKGGWRSKLGRRGRSERVTALHFAALFGEMDMARRLLAAGFNVNEVPYGYTTSLTPLKFAIGARRVDMVGLLIANGAKPTESETWSTLAGQLLNRSWLAKTMSESERDLVPHQITAIMQILMGHGWNINDPCDDAGVTVLHQAVGFWTGSFQWDLSVRIDVASFLCDCGADPFKLNINGKTPYALASASGHQDLLLILNRGPKRNELYGGAPEVAELSG